MARSVRCGLIQARCEWSPEKYSLADIRERMIVKVEQMLGGVSGGFAGAAMAKRLGQDVVKRLVIAIGLQTFMGSSGITSFGHVGFAAIGGYVASICTTPPQLKATVIPHAPSFLQDISLGFVPGTLVAAAFTGIAAATPSTVSP